jgi:hypothetical protein
MVAYLVFDRFKVPSWAWGAMGIILVIDWAFSIVLLWNTKEVDITEFLKTQIKK